MGDGSTTCPLVESKVVIKSKIASYIHEVNLQAWADWILHEVCPRCLNQSAVASAMVDCGFRIGGLVLFQAFEIVPCKKGTHLADGDFIELKQAFGLGNTLADENGIKALEICEDDELLKRGMVADVSLGIGMGIAPLLHGLSEQCDIEQVGFVGIDERCLILGECRWQERFLDRVRMGAAVDLGEGALEVPPKLEPVDLIILEAAKFFDQIDFELGADPHTKFEGNVGMRKMCPHNAQR